MFTKNLQLGLSSEKFVICEILHFTTIKNLGFQPLEKSLTTLQLLRILQRMIIISKSLRRITAWAIFRKICNLRFSHFTTFPITLVFNPYKRIGQLCSSLLYNRIISTTKLLRSRQSGLWFTFLG